MRNLIEVIDQMLAAMTPEEKANNIALVNDLESSRESTRFSAPELMGIRWHRVAENLIDGIGEDFNPETVPDCWQKRVLSIWMNKSF